MGKISYFYFNLIILQIILHLGNANIAFEKLCGDPQCETPISLARTVLTYYPGKEGFASFIKGQSVEVYAKSTDTKKEAPWDIKVNNKRGLAPRYTLIENKILVNSNNLIRITVEDKRNEKDSSSAALEQPKESQQSLNTENKIIETEPIELKASESTIVPEVEATHTATVPLEPQSSTEIKETQVSQNETIENVDLTINPLNSTPVIEIKNSEVEPKQIIDEAKNPADDDVTIEDDEENDDDESEEIEEIYDDDDDEEYDHVSENSRLNTVQNISTESEVNLNNETDPSLVNSTLIDDNKGVHIENISLKMDESKVALIENKETNSSHEVENESSKGLKGKEILSTETATNGNSQENSIRANIVNKEQNILSDNNPFYKEKNELGEGFKNTKVETESANKVEVSKDVQDNQVHKGEIPHSSTKVEAEVSKDVQDNQVHKGEIPHSNTEVEQPLNNIKHNEVNADSTNVIPKINKVEYLEKENDNLARSNYDSTEKTIHPETNAYPTESSITPELSISTPLFDSIANYMEATTEAYIESELSRDTNEDLLKADLLSQKESNSVIDNISTNQIDDSYNKEFKLKDNIDNTPASTKEPYNVNTDKITIENEQKYDQIFPSEKDILENNNINLNEGKEENRNEDINKRDQNPDVGVKNEKSGNLNNEGLFANIVGSLNVRQGNIDTAVKKKLPPDTIFNDDLKVMPDTPKEDIEESFCFNVDSDNNNCDLENPKIEATNSYENNFSILFDNSFLEIFDLSLLLGISIGAILMLILCYCCLGNQHTKDTVYQKLNITEKNLLASNKEIFILKHELNETKNKLANIENCSFGSNDMVVALKNELKVSEEMQSKLREQISSLESELENAAEAGLELNKIVSDLLSHQGGDESIISSVEQLQKQLNEQQNTIIEINAILAEKSRENSELQLMLVNQSTTLNKEIEDVKLKNEELEKDNIKTLSQLKEIENSTEEDIEKLKKEKSAEILSIQNELNSLKNKYEDSIDKIRRKDSKIQALEECLNALKSSKLNVKELLETVNLKAEISTLKKERDSLKERLEGEIDARKLLEDHVRIVSEEVSSLKQEYRQSEKEKLEAKTRLEVLSNYFKEKETQLQKELSVKEAMWLKQQGETTSTVERVRTMQDEIQSLKSQNDSLRAEIEAQTAAHKIQVASLENQAHETWLAVRKSDRKLEEAKSEAALLRRKLTSLVGSSALGDGNGTQNINEVSTNDLNNIPSPINMDSPVSPLMTGLPPPNFLPPPPFMAPPPPPPHPFIAMPLPFMPPHEVRSPSMERLMSPPPPPSLHGRYSFSPINDEDYRDRHLSENGRYSPANRCDYATDIISTYDTETDFSPPHSPRSTGSKETYNINDFINDREHNNRNYDRRSSPKSRCSSTNSEKNTKFKGSNFVPNERKMEFH